jgi:hypothetical protein
LVPFASSHSPQSCPHASPAASHAGSPNTLLPASVLDGHRTASRPANLSPSASHALSLTYHACWNLPKSPTASFH